METVTLAAGGEELIRLSIAGAGANASPNKSFFRCTASGDKERNSPSALNHLSTIQAQPHFREPGRALHVNNRRSTEPGQQHQNKTDPERGRTLRFYRRIEIVKFMFTYLTTLLNS
jgi:hypothetical protein